MLKKRQKVVLTPLIIISTSLKLVAYFSALSKYRHDQSPNLSSWRGIAWIFLILSVFKLFTACELCRSISNPIVLIQTSLYLNYGSKLSSFLIFCSFASRHFPCCTLLLLKWSWKFYEAFSSVVFLSWHVLFFKNTESHWTKWHHLYTETTSPLC